MIILKIQKIRNFLSFNNINKIYLDIDNKKDLQIEYIDNIRKAYLKKEKINKSIEKNTINMIKILYTH